MTQSTLQNQTNLKNKNFSIKHVFKKYEEENLGIIETKIERTQNSSFFKLGYFLTVQLKHKNPFLNKNYIMG